ncbi:MAG: 5-amino-6-(D-ribitylamino)uracil--L-tyrosine 4-hydroxyphenyl transferase CofH [Thaumarchaeota archaeon]|nr:5-amino-6-(D-ribitylamino)uracil--L-tyrosine 4-hydroxyphenyl transferase CofH [Nitrososphaerota archaeon]MDE1840095.1 5-amino-6-(D-ribitylamino)uracil--L-tyrosine 4-hydroxyphenyl transferase CofH [Nitrososphaerota archaeon]
MNMSLFESLLKNSDPLISDTLNRALEEKEISVSEAARLFHANGLDFHLVGMVADELRKRRVGDIVTYVVNRNINFTNVCIKQCGFCAFSRDFREEEGYFLPTDEIVRRAKEAQTLGATEVCVQAGLPPDMDKNTYENICRAIKREVGDIHIHGFSPEEVLYGATRSNISIKEYLLRLKDAGVNSLPGTAAEILDQAMRDKISPGRISVSKWIEVIKTAHKIGIPSTSTIMFGHLESPEDRARHMGLIRDIQKETGGFTEFVPLNFIHTEAPMYKENLHHGIKNGADGRDVLLMHAVARIMFNNYINNIQTSWVKEGAEMAQLVLSWGANDFGGTLINESISTAAGAEHGQLLKPRDIRHLIRQAGRIPAQRATSYKIIKTFVSEESTDKLDEIQNVSQFGSYHELIKLDGYRYKNNRRR